MLTVSARTLAPDNRHTGELVMRSQLEDKQAVVASLKTFAESFLLQRAKTTQICVVYISKMKENFICGTGKFETVSLLLGI